MSLVCRFAEPLDRFRRVGSESRLALPKRQAYPLLRVRIAVVRGRAKPLRGFSSVRLDSPARFQQYREIIFSKRLAFLGRASKPLRRLRKVLGNAVALEQQQPKSRLRLRDPLLCRL